MCKLLAWLHDEHDTVHNIYMVHCQVFRLLRDQVVAKEDQSRVNGIAIQAVPNTFSFARGY
jgi:hypothetical protein